MNKQHGRTLSITTAALCGAAYAVLTIVLAPISYGAIQFRVSEAFCILPFFIPSTVWGLYAGCIAANLLTGNVFDVFFGSFATLLAALLTCAIGKSGSGTKRQFLACLPPVFFNALIVGAIITKAYSGISIAEHPEIFALNAFQVGMGEAAVMLLVGFPLMRVLEKQKFFREFVQKVTIERRKQ